MFDKTKANFSLPRLHHFEYTESNKLDCIANISDLLKSWADLDWLYQRCDGVSLKR